MPYLYVSTDEANHLLYPIKEAAAETRRFIYHYIDPEHGNEIAKRIGFNPMCSIEFDAELLEKTIGEIVKQFTSKGLFAALESDGKIIKYIPQDIEARNELVKLAMRKEKYESKDPSYILLLYSNNPRKIREFK